MKLYKTLIPIIIVMILIALFIKTNTNNKTYTTTFKTLDTKVNIAIYGIKKENKTIDKIEKIYNEYNSLISLDNNTNNNLYYIVYNEENSDKITINKKLYQMIKFGKEWYKKSNHKIDISMGSVLEIYKMYMGAKSGYPSINELKRAKVSDIDDIVLYKNNKIKNNNIIFDLNYIARAFATEEVVNYLKKQNIKNYTINIGYNTVFSSTNKEYKIALPDSNEIINVKNKTVATASSSEKYYEYNKKKYHNLILPETLKQADFTKNVTVIGKNIKTTFMQAKILFLTDIDEGLEYTKKNNIEAIWYTNENKTIKSRK